MIEKQALRTLLEASSPILVVETKFGAFMDHFGRLSRDLEKHTSRTFFQGLPAVPVSEKENRMNILVVDDEPFQVQGLKVILRSWGHGVVEALNAEEALNLLESRRYMIDLVITDYAMPVMDGIELVKAIRGRIQDVPAILMTAYGDRDLVLEALRQRFDGFIEKPVSVEELKKEIERIAMNTDSRAFSHHIPELAHRLNNPLMAITGSAELGLLNMHAPESMKKCLDNILKATKSIKKINEAVMAQGRTKQPRVENIDVGEVLDRCLEIFADLILLKDIKVTRGLEGHEFCLWGDRDAFEQMITNLLLNAIEAMEDGPERYLSVTAKMDGPSLLLRVEDTGCGIPKDMLNKIFDPYSPGKMHGSGIGLSVVKDVVERHRGKIEVESHAGKGTVIEVILPINIG